MVVQHADSQTHDSQLAGTPYLDSALFCFLLFETGSHCVAQAILEPQSSASGL